MYIDNTSQSYRASNYFSPPVKKVSNPQKSPGISHKQRNLKTMKKTNPIFLPLQRLGIAFASRGGMRNINKTKLPLDMILILAARLENPRWFRELAGD